MPLTSEDIARHTQEYLDRGGVIHIIPFLHTTIPGHPDVIEYIRVYRYGNYIRGASSRVQTGREADTLPEALMNEFNNGVGGSE